MDKTLLSSATSERFLILSEANAPTTFRKTSETRRSITTFAASLVLVGIAFSSFALALGLGGETEGRSGELSDAIEVIGEALADGRSDELDA